MHHEMIIQAEENTQVTNKGSKNESQINYQPNFGFNKKNLITFVMAFVMSI